MKLFHKILIANRGEIAMRVIRSIRKLGLVAVAIYAENDSRAAHVREADQAWSLGDGPLSDTYLNINKIIRIAREAGCEAIHPGYGFLSERAAFAMACKEAGIRFIGPESDAINLMGNKVEARLFVQAQGIPVIEGRTGGPEELMAAASELSFPLLIKAAAGGGGKGMRIVREPSDLRDALEATSREAQTYFGDGTVYAERYLDNPRHIEVQVFGDQHGNAIHLFERECSVQRRYQKIIEESPSPSVNEALRERITRAAVAITRAISYSNAGTIEFLLEGEHDFFFLEMNTRIQVEHPVTEMITGVDLVREQILVAAGNPLSLKQHDLRIHGHAIECRVYAEDPARDFLPSPGQMTFYHLPEGEHIRVESGISDSLEVPADYDPMIAKVVVWGPDRQIAIERMERALQDTVVHGIASNVPFLLSLLRNDAYRENRVSTKFCDLNLLSLLPEPPASVKEAVLAYLMWWLRSYCDEPNAGKRNTWKEIGYWRNMVSLRLRINGEMTVTGLDYFDGKDFEMIVGEGSHFGSLQECGRNAVAFLCGEQRHHAWVSQDGKGNAWVSLAGDLYHLHREDVLTREDFFTGSGAGYGGDPGQVTSPMPGKVVKMMVREGEEVSMGQVIAIVEAMKMENTILSPANGTIDKVNVQEGDKVDTSLALVHLSSEESE